MNEEQRKECVDVLGTLMDDVSDLKDRLGYLIDGHQLHQDRTPQATNILQSANELHKLADMLRNASDELKQLGGHTVQEYVTEWYRSLHWDMDPMIFEIAEEDLEDPEYESIAYQGDDKWQVIMTTKTHGRERVVVQSDGATWWQCYSADFI